MSRQFRNLVPIRRRSARRWGGRFMSRWTRHRMCWWTRLDTFVQRRPEFSGRLRVFEVDQPGPQAWKRQRLIDAGYGVPDWLRLVPVDFEAGASWWDLLIEAGFSPASPAVAVSTGVSMYLTKEANEAGFKDVSHVSGNTLNDRYFSGRSDGLRVSTGEDFLVATL